MFVLSSKLQAMDGKIFFLFVLDFIVASSLCFINAKITVRGQQDIRAAIIKRTLKIVQ